MIVVMPIQSEGVVLRVEEEGVKDISPTYKISKIFILRHTISKPDSKVFDRPDNLQLRMHK